MWSNKLPNTYALAHLAAILLEKGQEKNLTSAINTAFDLWVKTFHLIDRETKKSRAAEKSRKTKQKRKAVPARKKPRAKKKK